MNEINHIKISLRDLPLGELVDDQWMSWCQKKVLESELVLALVTAPGIDPEWQCIKSNLGRVGGSLFGGFKMGALYEVETGLRTICSKRFTAEKYLAYIDSLPHALSADSGLSLVGMVSVTTENEAAFVKKYGPVMPKSAQSVRANGFASFSVQIRSARDALMLDAYVGKPDLRILGQQADPCEHLFAVSTNVTTN